MRHATREILFGKKKYILIELLLILLIFMVLFLSGLASGLGRAVSSAIENMDAEEFVLDDSAEKIITVSSVEEGLPEQLRAEGIEASPIDIQRMYLTQKDRTEKLNVTYFAIEPGSFTEPAVTEGRGLGQAEGQYPILLDDDYKAEGISLGETVTDSSTGLEFTVAGFVKDQMYGHTSVAFISTDTYTELRTRLFPGYQKAYHAIALRKAATVTPELAGVEVVSKQEIIEHIPSYTAEHLTITMIVWVLVIISAIIIGIFNYILTLQKKKQYGVMKALGTSNLEIAGIIISETGILSVFAAAVALGLAFGMGAAMPEKMPFYLELPDALMVTAAFVLISVAGSLLSIVNVVRIDPVIAIGGEEE